MIRELATLPSPWKFTTMAADPHGIEQPMVAVDPNGVKYLVDLNNLNSEPAKELFEAMTQELASRVPVNELATAKEKPTQLGYVSALEIDRINRFGLYSVAIHQEPGTDSIAVYTLASPPELTEEVSDFRELWVKQHGYWRQPDNNAMAYARSIWNAAVAARSTPVKETQELPASVFDWSGPQLGPVENGPEPSLRTILEHFYKTCCNNTTEGAIKLANQFIENFGKDHQ